MQAIALTLIGFLYTTSSYYVILPHFGFTVSWLLYEAAFTGVVYMALLSYFTAANTDPGSVPFDYQPDDDASRDLDFIRPKSQRNRRGAGRRKPRKARYCNSCVFPS